MMNLLIDEALMSFKHIHCPMNYTLYLRILLPVITKKRTEEAHWICLESCLLSKICG